MGNLSFGKQGRGQVARAQVFREGAAYVVGDGFFQGVDGWGMAHDLSGTA